MTRLGRANGGNMTVPAQQASGSSAAAQQASSSASASGQAPAIAKDTVAPGTSVTGLAGVLAEADAQDVAARIAQAVSSHVSAPVQEIRVIGDLSALSDIVSLKILADHANQLSEQVTAYASSVRAAPQAPEGVAKAAFFPVSPADVLNAGSAIIGVVSQLVSGTYTYSGQAIPNSSIYGLDILIARQLGPKTSVPVHVDRFAAMHADSQVLAQIQNLASQVATELNPALIQAAGAAAAKAQAVSDDKDLLTKLAADQAAIQKGPSPGPAKLQAESATPQEQYDKLQEQYDEVSGRMPGESEQAAAAQNLLTEGQALAAEISTFVTSAVNPPASGGPAPVVRAAHGELLSKTGTAILYAQIIAAGDDQVLRQTLIHNTWSNLTGVTAEYALLLSGAEAAAFGIESAFAVTHGSIRKGMTDIARKTVALHSG